MAFAPVFQRPFSATFDRRAAAAAAASWWLAGGVAAANAVAVYQPKGAASLAASYVNLANPGTYDAAPGTAPTWDVTNGWAGDGSTKWLNTGILPTSQNWSYVCRFGSYNADGNYRLFGTGWSTYRLSILPRFTDGKTYYDNGGFIGVARARPVSGVVAIAGSNAYFNGVDEGVTISGWVGTPTDTIRILCRYVGGNEGFFLGTIQAFAIYSDTLTAGEVAAVSAAMAAL